MALLDFPDTPTTGQLFGSAGTMWRFDGTRWASTAGASGARGQVAFAQLTANVVLASGWNWNAGPTVTFTADPSRRYRVTYSVGIDNNTAAGINWAMSLMSNGVQVHQGGGGFANSNNAAGEAPSATGVYVGSFAATTVTLSVGVFAGAVPANLTANGNTPSQITVEDITYEAGSTPPADPNRPWNSAWGLRSVSNFAANLGNGTSPGYIPILVTGAFSPAFVAGRKHRITFVFNYSNTVAGDFFQLTLKAGATNGPAIGVSNKIFPTINNYMNDLITAIDTSGTYQQWYFGIERASGSGNMAIVGTNNAHNQMTVEDIGPVTPL